MSIDTSTLYYLRLETMHQRYLRYEKLQQKREKKYRRPLISSTMDRKLWLLVMSLAETSDIVK